ncbi:hypothetical protein [Azospirillum largimobile]
MAAPEADPSGAPIPAMGGVRWAEPALLDGVGQDGFRPSAFVHPRFRHGTLPRLGSSLAAHHMRIPDRDRTDRDRFH